MPPTRYWLRLGLLTFLAHFLILLPSVAPSVPGGHDSGEVMSDAIVLGIPHPPGYPLYAMLGHLWTYLPVGEVGYRLNLFSAFCLSFGVGLLAVAFGRAIRSPWAGITAALMYGFALTPWRQGVGAEVFALHILIVCALVFGCILWKDASDDGRRKVILFGFAVFGLGAAHHHTVIFMVPGCFVWFVLARGRGRAWGLTWMALLVALFLGMAPYSYLYIRATQNCPLKWGDPSNWANFRDHVLRRGYGTGRLNPASGTVDRGGGAQAIGFFGSLVRNQFPFPVVLLAVAGALLALRRPDLMWLYGWTFFINGPGFALYSDQPPIEFFMDMVDRFYAVSMIGVAGFISLSLAWVEQQLRASRYSRLIYLMPLLALYSVAMNWSAASQRGQYQPYDHMAAIMKWLPPNAVICIDGDLPAGEWDYLHTVLGMRPDVCGVFPGLLGAPWYRRDWVRDGLAVEADERRFEAFQKGTDKKHLQYLLDVCRDRNIPVYCTSMFEEAQDGQYFQEGLVYRYLRKDEKAPTPEERLQTAKKLFEYLESCERRGDYRLDIRRQTFWTRYVIGSWVRAYRGVARDLYPAEPELAERALLRAIEMDSYETKDRVNLALLYMDRHDWDRANEQLDIALRLEPELPLALAAKVDLYRSKGDAKEADTWQARLEDRKRRGN